MSVIQFEEKLVSFNKIIIISLFLCISVIIAKAENDPEPNAEGKSPPPALEKESPEQSANPENSELVIGKNLKVNMTLVDAFKLLGLPKSINVKRGTDSVFDSIMIDYPGQGVKIHALSAGTTIEGIEMSRKFKGHFDTEIKIGDDFKLMIKKYGVPKSFHSGVANYPKLRVLFILDKNKIVSAKVFAKDTKLLSNRLATSKR